MAGNGKHDNGHEKYTVDEVNADFSSELDMTPEEERKLKRRIDFRLIPWCTVRTLCACLKRSAETDRLKSCYTCCPSSTGSILVRQRQLVFSKI